MTSKGTTMQINLQKFCGEDGGRYEMSHPWVFNGWKYATDGIICVRVRTTELDIVPQNLADFPPASNLFADGTAFAYKRWPEANYVIGEIPCEHCRDGNKKCSKCNGKGCDSCLESGYAGPHCDCRPWEECSKCNMGIVTLNCGSCDGTGLQIGEVGIFVEPAFIAAKYDKLIRSLGAVKYIPAMSPLPTRFFWDGGEGVVMGRTDGNEYRK